MGDGSVLVVCDLLSDVDTEPASTDTIQATCR